MTTGILYDDRFLDHDAGAGHPERRERLESAIKYLRGQPWFSELSAISPRVAEREWIEQIHDDQYIRRAGEACRRGLPFLDVADVGICADSCDVAYLAAGGAMELADKMWLEISRTAFP